MITATFRNDAIEGTIEIPDHAHADVQTRALDLIAQLLATVHIADVEELELEETEEVDDFDLDLDDERQAEDDVEVVVPAPAAERETRPPIKPILSLSCDDCPRTFPSKGSLAAHRRAMHSGNRIECGEPGCDFVGGSTNVVAMHRVKRGVKLAPVEPGTPPLLARDGPIDLDAARARAAEAL